MTGGPGPDGVPRTSPDDPLLRDPDVLAWMDEHLPEMRRSVYGQRLLYQSLAVAFVVGLAAQIGGYLLRPSPPTEPLALVADLLYALGWALWTGVVVTVFVQVIPEIKRRQFKQMLDAYEAARREQARAGGDQASGDDGAPTAVERTSGSSARLPALSRKAGNGSPSPVPGATIPCGSCGQGRALPADLVE